MSWYGLRVQRSKMFAKTISPQTEVKNYVSVMENDFWQVLLPLLPSKDDVFNNPIYDAFQNIFDIVDAIRSGETFEGIEPPSLEALKEIQKLFDRDDLTADTVIEIPISTLRKLEEETHILATEARWLHACLIPEEDPEPRRSGLVRTPDGGYAMSQLPPLSNDFMYGSHPDMICPGDQMLSGSKPLPALKGKSSEVLTRSARRLFDDLCYTRANLHQFAIDHRPKTQPAVYKRGLFRALSRV